MDKEQFSIDDLFLLKRINNVKILPDKKILFEEQKMSEKENKYFSAIYQIDENGENSIQFTSGLSQDKSMKLSPQKDKVAFLSSRGEEMEKPQIFIMPTNGGEAIRYTKLPNGVDYFDWSLDGQKIVFQHRVNLEEQTDEDKDNDDAKNKDDEHSDLKKKLKKVVKEEKEKEKIDPRVISQIVYRRGTVFLDDRYTHVYLLDLETKDVSRISEGTLNYSSPVLGKDCEKLYVFRHKEEGQLNDLYDFELLEIDLETKEEKILKTVYGFGADLLISKDGQWLAYVSATSKEIISTQNDELKLLNLETKEERWVSEGIDNHVSCPLFDDETNYIYFTVDDWEKNSVNRYGLDRETIENLYSSDYLIQSFDLDSNRGLLAMNVSSKDDLSQLIVYDYVNKKSIIIWQSNKQFLSERIIAETEEIRYKGYNDVEIQGWIVKPPNFDENKKYPMIVEIHGGPHATWSPHERSMWFEHQYLASQNYVIFYCNPQGSSGRGYDFRYIVANWGTKPADDILLGVDEVIKKGYVDENNLFVTGGSYGGYMTAWLIGNDQRFKAAVPQRGVYNLVSFWSITDITRFIKDEIEYFPWEDHKAMWDLSPISYVANVKTPTRIIHSENDFRVPIAQAEELFASLLKVGADAELIRYPEEGHELSRSGKPKHVKDRLEKISSWFNKYKDT
ncbi:MAG: S9 family peptidase [Candidatus Heimdallarchaeota archaeon]|nr:S9 family peptidase [Candidatus Heimdallarchaeota archaeon]MCK4770726.1 S9 family peptidase [Candidatus Heimdallarchaeota archaeon]